MHANRWQHFQIGDGAFLTGWNPRQKTGKPESLVVPAPFRPVLRAYWIQQGKPMVGPLFPLLRGERTGEEREQGSHAAAFRIELQRAFGIFVWAELPRKAGKPGRGTPRLGWVRAREMTERERELFVEGDFTLPVDFDSARRGFAIGMEDAGATVAEGAAAAGATVGSHTLYRRGRGRARPPVPGSIPDFSGVAEGIFGHQVANIEEGAELMNRKL